jgi:hypothetical protein
MTRNDSDVREENDGRHSVKCKYTQHIWINIPNFLHHFNLSLDKVLGSILSEGTFLNMIYRYNVEWRMSNYNSNSYHWIVTSWTWICWYYGT